MQAEFLAELGIATNPIDGQYRSTGAQAPADTSHTRVSGWGRGGVNLMATLIRGSVRDGMVPVEFEGLLVALVKAVGQQTDAE